MYNTSRDQTDGVVLEVTHFASSVNKSTSHFGLGFAYDAPMIWNEMPDDVGSANSLSFFRKQVENLSLCKSLPTPVFLGFSQCFLCGSRQLLTNGQQFTEPSPTVWTGFLCQ